MKNKLICTLLAASILLGSQSLLAAEVFPDPFETINDPFSENIEDIFNPEDEIIEETEQEVTAAVNEIVLVLDSKIAMVNGQEYPLLSPPKVIEGRTFLPLRFVVDNVLGAQVNWDPTTREVTVIKEDKIVVIKIGEKIVTVNGEKVEIDKPALIENNVTLLPIRFMSETFGITTNYNEIDRTITLVSSQETGGGMADNRPIAQFSFDKETYIAGQSVAAVDVSYDPIDNQIVERLWMINDNPNLTAPKLENIFKTPREGSYKISLKVRNNKGVWSTWTEQMLTINANQKPVVTSITPGKEQYAQGEAMGFTYTFENEDWESIKSERWTYRRSDEPIGKAVIDKPKALFTEGDYIVAVQLEDTYGNMGDREEIMIHITQDVIRTELDYKFTEGTTGEIIDNFKRVNYQEYQEIFSSETSTAQGTVIMSDSPEVVKQAGILYKENINGLGKILLHHIYDFEVAGNESDNKRLVLVAENTSNKPVRMLIENKTIKGPSADTLFIGQLLLFDYLKGSPYEEYILAPGEKKYIYDSVGRKWLKGQCISGLMDVVTDGQVTFTVAAVDQKTTIEAIESMPLLQKDIHPRGTFGVTDIYYTVDLGEGASEKLILGKGTAEWVNGHDALTGETVQNRGNFGISYHIKITAKQDMGIILNPRGNIFRGAIKWEGQDTYLIPSKGFFGADTTKAVTLGTIKAGETKEFEYMLPNGSSAPVLIGFIPKNAW